MPDVRAGTLALGNRHGCMVDNGALHCWGDNGMGQLGLANVDESQVAIRVIRSGVAAVAAGSLHTCVLMVDASVRCFGFNAHGQVGNGAASPSHVAPTTVNLPPAEKLSAGTFHTCAILRDGTQRCWGRNNVSQIGIAVSTIAEPLPRSTNPPLASVAQIVAGVEHTCVLLASQDARCWGDNRFGQLATTPPSSGGVRQSPSAVNGSGFTQIAAGESHMCALKGNVAACWGRNSNGQLGVDASAFEVAPLEIPGHAYSTVASGSSSRHTCAITTTGLLDCWGLNTTGQLGLGFLNGVNDTPRRVGGLANVTEVAMDADHTCARQNDGSVHCWGSDLDGRLGNGAVGDSSAPTVVKKAEVFMSGFES
jgi:alpha-tubulin suppressor-like RCC1 family protein